MDGGHLETNILTPARALMKLFQNRTQATAGAYNIPALTWALKGGAA